MENPKFYIEKVDIKGLFGKHDLSWELNSDVNILAGMNGIGKSTILRTIYSLTVDKLDGKFYEAENLDEISVTTNFYKENGDKKLLAIFSEDYYEKINYNFQYINTFDNLLKNSSQLATITDKRVKTELDLKLFSLQISFQDLQLKIVKQPNNYKNVIQDFYDLVDEIFRFSNKKANRSESELAFLNEDDLPLNVYQLSSGEKQMLIILLTVLMQNQQPSILLLDEPELSLHFDWQRNFISHLRRLNPNCQLIIASHSPGIAMNGWVDKVFEVSDLYVKSNEKAAI